jgi:putative transposase
VQTLLVWEPGDLVSDPAAGCRTGHFWQGSFGAVVMDERHLAAAVSYVALNPVRARLVEHPEDWPWSSVHAHLAVCEDGVTTIAPVLERFPGFAKFIAGEPDPAFFAPLVDFLARL